MKNIIINMSKYLKNLHTLHPEEEYEIKLLEMYNFKKKPFNKFTIWLLKQLYNNDEDYDPIEIETFYNLNTYNNIIIRLITEIENIIMENMPDYNFYNIEVVSIVKKTKDSLLVEVRRY